MRALPEIDDHDHVDGPGGAPVTLIEYADFECPFCVAAYPAIEAVRDRFRGSLRFVYRHVPRSSRDGFTKQAAEAAEAAAAQGNFWGMHRELYRYAECQIATCGAQYYIVPIQPRTFAVRVSREF